MKVRLAIIMMILTIIELMIIMKLRLVIIMILLTIIELMMMITI